MPENFYMWFVAALIPLLVGYVYYSDALFGKTMRKVNGFSDDFFKKGNPAVIFGVSYLFCVFLAVMMTGLSLHQTSTFSMMMPEILEKGSSAQEVFTSLMDQYGDAHRNFSHGALHGVMAAILFALPILGIIALFERTAQRLT